MHSGVAADVAEVRNKCRLCVKILQTNAAFHQRIDEEMLDLLALPRNSESAPILSFFAVADVVVQPTGCQTRPSADSLWRICETCVLASSCRLLSHPRQSDFGCISSDAMQTLPPAGTSFQ